MEAGFPRIHGFVYDVGEGLLRKLDIDFKAEIKKCVRFAFDVLILHVSLCVWIDLSSHPTDRIGSTPSPRNAPVNHRSPKSTQNSTDPTVKMNRNLAIYKLYDFKNSGILMKRALDEAEEQEEQEQQKKAATATAAAAGKKK